MATFRQVLRAKEKLDKLSSEALHARFRYDDIRKEFKAEAGKMYTVGDRKFVIIREYGDYSWVEVTE